MTKKKPRVAVVLAGCGFKDGAEIRESVFALLGLDMAGADIQCVAPEKQIKVVNHLTFEETGEERSLLNEAARIARGNIKSLSQVTSSDFDAVVLPGGFGAAKNLCDFAFKGKDSTVDPQVSKFLLGFVESKKPIGAICIAPVIIAKLFEPLGGVKLTLGEAGDAAKIIESWKSKHVVVAPDEIVIDSDHKVVTTPAYMYSDASLSKIFEGIRRLSEQIVRWC